MQPGTEISHYRILDELGRGGMGVVYRAEDTKLRRTVALKLLSPHMLGSEADRNRFYREARAAAGLQHPNIGTVYEIDEADGHVFIALEFIDGETLSDLIERGPLPLEEVISIGMQIASGLSAAHEKNIVHRDMKSGNVMLTNRGAVKILDFGLAKTAASTKLTQMGSTLGTIAYMSVEQARGEEVDRRSDIWSLGAVLYEMISGKTPFPGDYEQAVIYGILNDQPKPLTAVRTGVPLELERIVEKCLRKDRDLRYQHVDELVADLKSIDLGAGPPAATREEAPQRSSRVGWPQLALVGVFAALIGWIVGSTWSTGSAEPEGLVSAVTRVTTEEALELDPAVSPDGSMIAYVGGVILDTELFVQHVKGGNRISVVPSTKGRVAHPAWSPDGSRLAFENDGEIFLVPALGGTPEPFILRSTEHPEPYASPAWSPDGTQLAFAGKDQVFVADITTKEKRLLFTEAEVRSIVWSPDGTRLAGSAGNLGWTAIHASFGNVAVSNIWVYDFRTGEHTDVTGSKHQNDSPAWDGTSSGLYFLSDRGGGMDVYHVDLTDTGGPVSSPERVTVGLGAHTIGSDAAGSRIAASKLNLRRNIWRVRIDPNRTVSTREAEQVTFGSQLIEALDISADGTRLIYDSNVRGNQDIYLKAIGAGESIQLTTDLANDFLSSWIDGKKALIYSLRRGQRDVYVLDTETRDVELIVDDSMQVQHPHFSRDGTKLVYRSWNASRDGFSILEKAADGSWNTKQFVDRKIQMARWSPTDDRIVFAEYSTDDEMALYDPVTGDTKYLLEGGDLHVVSVRWSTDGSTIYFLGRRGAESGIWSIPASGGPYRHLVAFDEPDKMYGFLYIASDDTYLYFTLKEAESDVWMLEVE